MKSVTFTIDKPSKKKWYVIACEAGSEKKVIRYIKREKKIRDNGTDSKIGRFVIPRHLEKRIVNGIEKQFRVKSFPGYILVNMEFTDSVMLLIEDAKRRGSFGLLPLRQQFFVKNPDTKKAKRKTNLREEEIEDICSWTPTAVDSEEAALVLLRTKEKKTKPKTTNMKPGCLIKVTDEKSAYYGQEAKITSVIPTSRGFEFVAEMKLMDRYVTIRVKDTDCVSTHC